VTAEVREAHVEVGGAVLQVRRRGSGPPFLWGHGLTSSMAREDDAGLFDWSRLTADRELVRYDARGHGRSGHAGGEDAYGWGALAGDLFAVADACGFDTFAAGGASMGAATTLHAAVARPDRIEAMVLVIPPTAWESRPAQRAVYEGSALLVEEAGIGGLMEARAALPPPPLLADHPELLGVPPDVHPSVLPTVFRGAASTDLPPLDQLATLDQPTLVLAWEGDPAHPVSTARALAAALIRAELVVASGLADVTLWPARVAAFLRGRPQSD
jgi:pimeloyl-ACP methyl ester carboxylesterase